MLSRQTKQIQYSSLLIALISFSCSKPTKCECKAELEKVSTRTAITGNVYETELSKRCDQAYRDVEAYINEPCPNK
jgi:hypothetical protein